MRSYPAESPNNDMLPQRGGAFVPGRHETVAGELISGRATCLVFALKPIISPQKVNASKSTNERWVVDRKGGSNALVPIANQHSSFILSISCIPDHGSRHYPSCFLNGSSAYYVGLSFGRCVAVVGGEVLHR